MARTTLKHDSTRRSHRKKSKKAKRKSHKKQKKSEKHIKRSDESHLDSSTSTSSTDSERVQTLVTHQTDQKNSCLNEESQWNELFSNKNIVSREKGVEKKNPNTLDLPGQSAKELNPYWKDGGNGLPPCKKNMSFGEMYPDVSFLTNDQNSKFAESTSGLSEQTLWRKKQPIAENEMRVSHNRKIGKHAHHQLEISSEKTGSAGDRRLNFKKPGEMCCLDFNNSYQRNWQKKGGALSKEGKTDETTNKKISEEYDSPNDKKSLTHDELNSLVAKALKAEIMGDKALAEKLKKEVEVAKEHRHEPVPDKEPEANCNREIVLLCKTNSRGSVVPLEGVHTSNTAQETRKRKNVGTHKGKERMRYFLDDDKHSLQSMFEREKLGFCNQSDDLFLKMAKKHIGMNENDDMADEFVDRMREANYGRKEEEREQTRNLSEAKLQHKSLKDCRWCLDGSIMPKHLIVSVGSKCYLCLPSEESLTIGHCLIVPMHHESCGTQLDEDVWSEIQIYRNSLCEMFEASNQNVLFFENARAFHRYPHMVLHCVPVDKEVGDLAPIYFKKAILDSETEWSNNKKLIDLSKKDLRRSIPKGLPYFFVDFGRKGGFAHVIEDEKLFPGNFAQEIIGGMLDMDPSKWRRKMRESIEIQKEKVSEFVIRWRPYEPGKYKKKS